MPLINFSGLASGIDSEALIEATTEATRQQRAVPLEEEIAELEDENDSLDELKILADELKDIADRYTTLNGGVVAKNVSSSDETLVSAIASDAALNGSYEVTVNSLATNATVSFGARGSSSTDVIDANITGGTGIGFEIGDGANQETFSVSIDNTTTYSDFVTAFNSASSKATAALVNVSPPDQTASYAIVITSDEVGLDDGDIDLTSDLTTTSTAPNIPLGINTSDNSNFSQNDATNSNVTLSGIATPIERSSNTINDLITGVTLNLNNADTNTTVSLTVDTDSATTEANIQEFVDKYNEIIQFIDTANQITREEDGNEIDNIFGPLANTRVDDNFLTSVRQEIAASSNADGDSVKIFADFGITTDRDGTLSFAKTATDSQFGYFEQAIANDPDSINTIFKTFADAIAPTGGIIDQYTGFNRLFDSTTTSNTERISDLNERLGRVEDSIARTEQSLRQRFARLESLTSQLQSQQSALSSALAGLGGG